MKWFNNLSTQTKLILAFGVMWLLMAVVVITAYRSITVITQSAREMNDVHFKISDDLSELRANTNFTRAQILEMIMETDKSVQKGIERKIKEDTDKDDAILDALPKLNIMDSHFQSQLDELKNILTSYRQTREQEISLIYNGKGQEAQQLGQGTQEERFNKIRSIALELKKKTIEDLNTQLALQQQKATWSIRLFVILGVFSVLFGVAMVVLLYFTMARPLNAVSNFATRIASGDLSVNVPTDERSDEMGLMTQAFRRMVEVLRHTIADITDGIALLGSSSSEILASTTQVASGTAESATAINETTTTVEEVRQASQLSSEKAKNVSEKSQRVAQVAQSGQKAVADTVSGIENIRKQMESIAQTIVRLSEQSQSIGGIIASVTDIADQSNLLSVNAAIEASRAGEQGKGFTVVAQEIKLLAEQSKQATTQVRDILNDVQKATSAAVMATEQGSKAVEVCVKQSAQAGEAIKVLAESSTEAAQTATQIVASSQQQVVGMDQIGTAMQNINQAGAQTAASMRQVEIVAQNLNELGQKLKGMVEQFKR